MGFLTVGIPLDWEDSKKYLKSVRYSGIRQFLYMWNRTKDRTTPELKFGDEIEYSILRVNREKRTVQLSLRGAEIIELLSKKEQNNDFQQDGCIWHPEYGSFMVEATPSEPYKGHTQGLLNVERNMRLRRSRLVYILNEDEIVPSCTVFPLLGTPGKFWDRSLEFEAPKSQSQYIPDFCINTHPRFGTLTQNIRKRRGNKVDIRVPLFHDENTPEFKEGQESPYIHMDCMAFGMGMCCAQLTFQTRTVDEARFLYDQLAVLAPIMLALTAATPMFKGRLADIDVRWSTISGSVDDRTRAEKGLEAGEPQIELAGEGRRRIYKSRYDSISCFIYKCRTSCSENNIIEKYNDIECEIDEEIFEMLLDSGIDRPLARHVAHLFIRDPLVIMENKITSSEDDSDHWESIQSTNWQTCRWKPPTSDDLGWRVEFRSMEVQLTDFENAAFCVFVMLVSRAILAFDLNLYMNLSKVDENMKRAHSFDAVNREKFWFRQKLVIPEDHKCSRQKNAGKDQPSSENEKSEEKEPHNSPCCGEQKSNENSDSLQRSDSEQSDRSPCDECPRRVCIHTGDDEVKEFTMKDLMCGTEDSKCENGSFVGFIPLVYAYLEYAGCDGVTKQKVEKYLELIRRRASGELPTCAQWQRRFVQNHPEYKKDSVVTEGIAYDLLMMCKSIGEGEVQCSELLGDFIMPRVTKQNAYSHLLSSEKLSSQETLQFLNQGQERFRQVTQSFKESA